MDVGKYQMRRRVIYGNSAPPPKKEEEPKTKMSRGERNTETKSKSARHPRSPGEADVVCPQAVQSNHHPNLSLSTSAPAKSDEHSSQIKQSPPGADWQASDHSPGPPGWVSLGRHHTEWQHNPVTIRLTLLLLPLFLAQQKQVI